MLHNSFCSWLTPSILFVFVRLFYFLLSPRSYSCSGKKCALPHSEPLVDHRPRSDMVRRGCNVCGGEVGIVTSAETQPQFLGSKWMVIIKSSLLYDLPLFETGIYTMCIISYPILKLESKCL